MHLQDIAINPSTYKTLDSPGYWGVHAIGEVWAEILWIVSQKLIKKHGFSDTLFPPLVEEDGTIPTGDFYRTREYEVNGDPKPLVPKHGNSLITQLVINGMKLQPCRPSFFEARDASGLRRSVQVERPPHPVQRIDDMRGAIAPADAQAGSPWILENVRVTTTLSHAEASSSPAA